MPSKSAFEQHLPESQRLESITLQWVSLANPMNEDREAMMRGFLSQIALWNYLQSTLGFACKQYSYTALS